MRLLLLVLIPLLLSNPLLWGEEPKSILDKGLTPDPDIFDGTFAENWERENETPRYARVGETSYGNSLEGKENKVKGWVQKQGENPGQQGDDPRRQGSGIGNDGEPEDQGGGGGKEEEPIEQVENPIAGGGGEKPPEQEAGGGGNSEQPQMQTAGGGGGSNPLEMLKKITSSAQSQKSREQMGSSGEENNEEDPTFGNNTYQVEVQEQSADVLGSNPEQAEKPEDKGNRNRSAASGRQETTRGGGSETGDDLPSGI